MAQMREMLAGDKPVGRKLDFLVQEMNREANTIGSKCNDVAIAQVVVNLKAEVEQLKNNGISDSQIAEAVQNYLADNPIEFSF